MPKYVKRHESLWELDVLRISLYGVDEDSYYEVTKRRGAFQLVKNNIIEFLKERNKRQSGPKLGLNFIVLVNTTDQVLRLLDLIRDINMAVHDGPGVDFLTLRENFNVIETEGLTPDERLWLVEIFKEFNERRRRECPELQVDFGYALYALSKGVLGKPLAMVTHRDMYPKAYPQVSVAIDLLGDVYLYRDAAFLDRPGADRYKIGTVTKARSLEKVVRDFLENGREIPPLPRDPALMDAFDHVVTKVIWQAQADEKIGISFNLGPVRDRLYHPDDGTEESGTPRVNYWERLE
jgi:dTDP-4-amino-4,6-dideoxy-D-glucose ammonia-lyase